MRTAPLPLLPLLRSRVQGDFLALTFLHPDDEYSVGETAARIGRPIRPRSRRSPAWWPGGCSWTAASATFDSCGR